MTVSGIRWKRLAGLVVVTALAAGLAGYAFGKRNYHDVLLSSSISRSLSADTGSSANRRSDTGQTSKKSADAQRVKAIRKELLVGYRCSPDISADWDLEEKSSRLLKEMSAADLVAFYQEIMTGDRLVWSLRLRMAVMWELLHKDPKAGMAVVEESASVNAFREWGKRDKDSALTWLREGPVPPALEKQKLAMQMNLLMDLAKSDFTGVEQEVSAMQGEDRSKILRALAETAAGDPVARERILALAAESGNAQELTDIQRTMVKGIAYKDFGQAVELIGKLDVPAAEKAELEGQAVNGSKDKIAALQDWTSRHPDESTFPGGVTETVRDMMFFRSNEGNPASLKWLQALPEGAQRDSIYLIASQSLAGNDDFARAASLAVSIANEEQRQSALQKLNSVWQASNKQTAEVWRAGLSVEDRAALKN